ncbi:hypothetical protein CICLE_v10006473mg [Citrus x clementina]|uniref:ABC transporter domain-containing protein n=1 Tax=Citrus clementina TaxID=85681 RepID=V4S015_CITCL|nr:hypothetical protein CICLE_v10006473mg [Citrus x clementina]GAY45445.1 hypothetical protein CUMW_089560 [Citrus unshiu]
MAPTGGEVRRRQKLRIGRHSRHLEDLLTMEPHILISDEPTDHLDTQSIVAVAVTLDEFAEYKEDLRRQI